MLDVVVVGAGPAGNGAALGLARAGFQVAVVDSRTAIGDKLCTGIVSLACLREFPATVPVIHRSSSSATVVGPSGKRLRIVRADPQAHIIDRVAYVRNIADQAEAAGAEYVLGWAVSDLQRDSAGVHLALARGDERSTLDSRLVVIATGMNPRLPHALGLGKPADFAFGAQVEVLAPEADEVEVHLGSQYAPGFFGWMVPTGQGKALLGVLARRDAASGLARLLASLEASGAVVDILSPVRRWGVPLRPLRKTVADRAVIVGDAAGQVKPATGGGIYFALLAARAATVAITEAFEAGDLSERGLKRYEMLWSAKLSSELAMGARLRALGERLSDEQLDHLVSIGSSGLVRDLLGSLDLSFDWHSKSVRQLLAYPGLDVLKVFGIADLWRRLVRAEA